MCAQNNRRIAKSRGKKKVGKKRTLKIERKNTGRVTGAMYLTRNSSHAVNSRHRRRSRRLLFTFVKFIELLVAGCAGVSEWSFSVIITISRLEEHSFTCILTALKQQTISSALLARSRPEHSPSADACTCTMAEIQRESLVSLSCASLGRNSSLRY